MKYYGHTQSKKGSADHTVFIFAVRSSDSGEAADGGRTRDLRLGKPTLYQLSYPRRAAADITRPAPRLAASGWALPFRAVSRRLLPILVSILGACLIGLLIYGISHQAASRTLDEALAHGQYPLAPNAHHSLAGLSGTDPASLASFGGKVVVLNFWHLLVRTLPGRGAPAQRAQRQLQRHDATVLGVTYLDASPDSESFVRKYHLTYPNLRDTTGDFAHAYGTDQLPESFVIDRQGHIVAISREIDQAFLNRAIALAERS